MSDLWAGPPLDAPDDVERHRISFRGRDGASVDAILYRPRTDGIYAAVAIGAEGTGTNRFIERVGAALAHRGIVALIVDPYRNDGPPDPEDYEDFETLVSYINALDFVRASTDVLAGVQYLQYLDFVDRTRVGVWGYCTGATLALLAASLDQNVAAAVLFYPSQPVFDEINDRTPVHPMDLLWGIACPTLFLYGDDDVVMPPDRLAELRRRLEHWHVDHELAIYAGAGHAFCSEAPLLFHHDAAARGWQDALAFIARTLGVDATARDTAEDRGNTP
jgi:carboxymethylenebutenolidase